MNNKHMSLKVEYGFPGVGVVDVTDVCLAIAQDGIVTIPMGDCSRRDFFSPTSNDPADGFLKSVFVTLDDKSYVFNQNYTITVDTVAKTVTWDPNDTVTDGYIEY